MLKRQVILKNTHERTKNESEEIIDGGFVQNSFMFIWVEVFEKKDLDFSF